MMMADGDHHTSATKGPDLVSCPQTRVCFCMFVSRWADKLDVLSTVATSDPEGFLGHPVNAFKLIKRLNTEWAELENMVLTDTSDGTQGQNII